MTDTQMVKELVGLEPELNILKIEEVKLKGKIVKIIYVSNGSSRVRCPHCNKYTRSVHSKLNPVRIKYLDIAGYTTYLEVYKRRFNCKQCNKIFTEANYINEMKKTLSLKLEQKILMDLRDYNLSVSYIAVHNNISDNTVRNVLKSYMKDYPKYLRLLPSVISFDEFKADTRRGKYAFIVNDVLHKTVLDILPTRKKDDLIQYFTHIENRSSVQYVISDMYEPYLLVTTIMFPKAKYVVDRFHYIRYIMDALDKVRIRLQKEYGYESKEYNMLKNKKNVSLLRKYSNDISWWVEVERYKNGRMVRILPGEIIQTLLSLDDDLKRGYQLKELFLDIVNHSTYEDAKTDLKCWIDLCRESQIEEFLEASSTIENWLEYIANSFIDDKFSNGFTEGLNNKIKVIKRVGFGYKNFDFFRLRLLYILKNKNSKKTQSSKNKKGKK
jgi:transposase